MHKERVLNFGADRKFLVSEKGEIRSADPFFLATLPQLEFLILKSKGFRFREIGPILLLSKGRIINIATTLYETNENSYGQLLCNAMELSLLNTVAVRGIISSLGDDKIKKENTIIVESMEKAIKEKNGTEGLYTSFSPELRNTALEQPIPISIPINQLVTSPVA